MSDMQTPEQLRYAADLLDEWTKLDSFIAKIESDVSDKANPEKWPPRPIAGHFHFTVDLYDIGTAGAYKTINMQFARDIKASRLLPLLAEDLEELRLKLFYLGVEV